MNAFVAKHRGSANKLLNSFANSQVTVYTFLFKNYLKAFRALNLVSLKKFKGVYHSENVRGSGDHRGRLSKVIHTKLYPSTKAPTYFRSGCCNDTKFLGFLTAGEAIGTSLAYISKNKKLFQYSLDAINQGKQVFIDNGVITAVNAGKSISNNKVMTPYTNLVRSVSDASSLSIVIPDVPDSQAESLGVIQAYKNSIRWLASRCNVIIVFHKGSDWTPLDHLRKVTKELGEDINFTIGIPCRTTGQHDWRLPAADIEKLFNYKVSVGNYFVKKAHFLALSEFTRGQHHTDCMNLCEMYGVELLADSPRVPALFGNEQSSNRQGSVVSRQLRASITKSNIQSDQIYIDYNRENEIDEAHLWDLINDLDWQKKFDLWEKVSGIEFCSVSEFDDEMDLEEYYWQIVSYVESWPQVFEKIKDHFYQEFWQPELNANSSLVRTEAIIACHGSNRVRNSVQLPFGF